MAGSMQWICRSRGVFVFVHESSLTLPVLPWLTLTWYAVVADLTYQTIEVTADTLVRSHTDIITTDISWWARDNTELVFEAPSVTLKRSKVRRQVTSLSFGFFFCLSVPSLCSGPRGPFDFCFRVPPCALLPRCRGVFFAA